MEDVDGWQEFIQLCLKIKSKDAFDQFFSLFLSIEEKKTLSSRCKIIQELLRNELSQRDIASHCHVSIAQITRGSNALKQIDPRLKDFLRNLL